MPPSHPKGPLGNYGDGVESYGVRLGSTLNPKPSALGCLVRGFAARQFAKLPAIAGLPKPPHRCIMRLPQSWPVMFG